VTAELARDARMVRTVDAESLAASRRARLARLRAAMTVTKASPPIPNGTAGVPPAFEPEPVAVAVGRRAADRTAELARQLGGQVRPGPAGPVVAVDREHILHVARDALRGLPEPLDPDRPILCLDTETTGLGTAAGTVPFLVGLGAWQGDRFTVRQLVLADHPDEVAFLEALRTHIPEGAQLVTYNGRSFDWPLLVTRYRLHRLPLPSLGGHLDLLPLARRLWRHRLPDARLASVEAGICAVRRHGDLPGADIPARYLSYLRTGRADGLHDVLRHNEQDIVSLAMLLRVLAEDLLPAGPGWSSGHGLVAPSGGDVHAGDLAGLGAAFSRRGRHREALACYESALERIDSRRQAHAYEHIAAERARTLARLGQRREAESAWQAVALEGGRLAALAWIQVAKHREHDAGDFGAALAAASRARSLAERARLFGWPDRLAERDLSRRFTRLQRRIAASRETADADPSGWVPVGSAQPAR
jgi:uncharacterized protein